MQEAQFKITGPKQFIREAMANYNGQSSFWLMVLVNLIPIAGVLFFGWDAYMVFGLYIIESFIVGIFHAIKLAIVNVYFDKTGIKERKLSWGNVPFFLVHFNFFLIAQFLIFSDILPVGTERDITFVSKIGYVISTLLNGVEWYAVSAIFLNMVYSLFYDFIYNEAYKNISAGSLFIQPYQRILVQQIVVILSGLIAMVLGYVPTAFIILFCLAKIFSDMVYQLNSFRFSKIKLAAKEEIITSSDPSL